MGTFNIKASIEQYFIDNWSDTDIQFEGLNFDYSNLDSWISLKYIPVENISYAFDGTYNGRIKYNAQLKVFCYAKSVPLAFKLGDDVKTFLNNVSLPNNIEVYIGQDRGANDLGNGYFETEAIFKINQFS